MISLIKNELTKIFKKKSILVVTILTLILSIAMNIIIKNTSDRVYSNYYYSEEYEKEIDEQLSKLNPEKASDNTEYINLKTIQDTIELSKKYPGDGWQQNVIQDSITTTIGEMNLYQYSTEKDEQALEETKQNYNEMVQKLNDGDWKYFAQIELENVNKQIVQIEKLNLEEEKNSNNNSELKSLKVKQQALKWRVEKDIPYGNSYLSRAIENYTNYIIQAQSYEESLARDEDYSLKKERQNFIEKANLYRYDIENGTETQKKDTARGMLIDVFYNYEIIILVVIIMCAGVMISEEFNKGTIKLLLVRPYKRTTILVAKFITCLIMIAIAILFVICIQFIVGGCVFGWDSLKLPVIQYNFNTEQVIKLGIIPYLLQITVARLPIYILLVTLSFAISTICNNSPLAIALPLLGYMASSTINMVAQAYHWDWIKYFVTPNWDLTQYLNGGLPEFEGLTAGFSIAICAVYFIIMMVPTFEVFKRKNIKNI